MTLDEIDSEEEEPTKQLFIQFPNPKHPDTQGIIDQEKAEKHFKAIEEMIDILGPDIRVFLGEAAHVGLQADKIYGENNPEPLVEFANELLKGTNHKLILEEVEDD